MATSGSYNFTVTRNEIIAEAMEICGLIQANEAPTALEVVSASRKLNLMVKAWMAKGLNLWAVPKATLFLVAGQTQYTLGATDHCTETYAETTLASAMTAGSTAAVLTSATGVTNGDFIGIMQDSGALYWTTISALAGVNATLTGSAITASAAGNTVYAYTTKIQRPLRIVDMWRQESDIDTPITLIPRQTYDNLSAKQTSSTTIQAFYDKQLTSGKLFVWPAMDNARNIIQFHYQRPLMDFDTGTDNADFPAEWSLALTYNLAVLMGPGYGVPLDRLSMIKNEAGEYLRMAEAFDHEDQSVQFMPDYQYNG